MENVLDVEDNVAEDLGGPDEGRESVLEPRFCDDLTKFFFGPGCSMEFSASAAWVAFKGLIEARERLEFDTAGL